MNVQEQQHDWDLVIESKSSLFDLKLKDVWRYRDLLLLFVRRDFVTFYKQTILGPLWFIIQPLLTTITFTIIFGRIAGIATGGTPQTIFYMSGIIIWNYFSQCLTDVSAVFTTNAAMFGKVYFPRLIMPLKIVLSNLIKFGVQYLIFIIFLLYYIYTGEVKPNAWVLLTPYLIVLMAGMSLGIGMIISSMTAKYKDLRFLINFGVQLIMYVTPIIYPLSKIPSNYLRYYKLNPLVGLFEAFKHGYLGTGSFSIHDLWYSTLVSIGLLVVGTLIFNKVEKNFMDTV